MNASVIDSFRVDPGAFLILLCRIKARALKIERMTAMSESRIDRIKRMEDILDEANEAIKKYYDALGYFIAMQKKIKTLEAYYTGGQWQKDYEYDEKGKLPADLKRGVLSQDAISDLLDRNNEVFEHFKGDI